MGLSNAEVCASEKEGSEWEGEGTQSWGLTSQSESSEDEPDFFWLDASAGHEEKVQRRETGKNREKNPNLLARKKKTSSVDQTNEVTGMYSDHMQRLK